MRKSMYVVLALMAGLLVWSFASQTTATAAGPKNVPPGFGNKVAGCYYVTDVLPAEGSYLLANLSADGGVIWTGTGMYGSGDPETNGLLSGVQGTWIRTGQTDVTKVMVGFGFDADGTHTLTWKAWYLIEFDDEFETGHAEGTFAGYYPDQNPLDPEEEPFLVLDSSFTMQRLNVE